MAFLGSHDPNDLVYQENTQLKVGVPPTGIFGEIIASSGTIDDLVTTNLTVLSGFDLNTTNLSVTTLTVTSGANLPAFNILNVNPGGTSSLGTVVSGVWNGDTVTEEYGGTGQSTYAQGDILVSDATDSLAVVASGAEGQLLGITGGVIGWNYLGTVQASGASPALLPNIPSAASLSQSTEWLQIETDSGTRYIPVWS